MKKLIMSCLFISLTVVACAQLTDTIVKIDTINLRGFVYGYDNKPAKNIGLMIDHRFAKFRLDRYPATTKTDSNGYFEFKGANPQGWVKFVDAKYYPAFFRINSSRYMVIYLPQERVINANLSDSINITAKRESIPVRPSFKITYEKSEWPERPDKEFEFIPGYGQLPKYLQKNIIYPEAAIKNNIEGEVVIEFSLTIDGHVTNFKIIKGIGYGCEEQVIAQIKKAGKWRPGIYYNKPMLPRQIVTVQFKLTDK